ncbi:MADS-box protein FLOWERING LOCUS C-like [Rhodamnia argentea]|uniref:MADS-box protein FLOWERING LOCUS C-like n=1 Tax=Rhodamnia argentea TaxID=178133 RepID=A0ABM3HPN7_9MYRT|nr:MADS-box protein FLOWERING LOCUS C-like [Rhodamnia argentea]
MGRRKLPLELITNEKVRRITYEKRKKGLMKKAQELATLCGVDTCMIIHGPAGSSASAAAAKPEIWPASPEKVKRIIRQYMSEGGDRRAKRTVGLAEFFANQKRKVDAELAKARLANMEAKYPISEALIGNLSKADPTWLYGSLGQKLDEAKARLAVVKEDATRRSSRAYDHHVQANHHHVLSAAAASSHGPFMDNMLLEGTPSFKACYGALMVQPVPPGQDFHFAATPEETMRSETSSYGLIVMDDVSLEGSPSFETYHATPMFRPAPAPEPLWTTPYDASFFFAGGLSVY